MLNCFDCVDRNENEDDLEFRLLLGKKNLLDIYFSRAMTLNITWNFFLSVYLGGPNAPQTASESVRGMRRLIEEAATPGSARFQVFDGTPVPW